MNKITLYRYQRDNGGFTISPEKPDKEYTTLTRLIADKDCALINEQGKKVISVDTERPEDWSEVSAPELWEGLED